MIAEQGSQLASRNKVEAVLRRAELLDEPERALLEQVVGHHVPPRDVAMTAGVTPRAIQRRVHRLLARLTHPEVERIIRERRAWDRLTAEVATAVWIKGWSYRRTARAMGVSLHRVRQRVETIRGRIGIGY